MDWIKIVASFAEPPPDWSVFADAFDRYGCPGSLQTDSPPSMSAYLASTDGARRQAGVLKEELCRLGADSVGVEVVPDEDWSGVWKQYFKPRRIGSRLVIRPTWEPFEAGPGDLVIVLDPGQAFGTGDHPTTRLCLELLEAAKPEGTEVADIGSGSGVLAIGARLLGARKVSAVDIDPVSVDVCRANAALNGVDIECCAGNGFEPLGDRTFDIVVSNIISAVLIRLAPAAYEHTRPGGRWIVSGIIRQNWADVRQAAENCGFMLIEGKEEDEWVGATFRR